MRELRLRATNNSSEGARLSKGLGCELRPSGPRRLDWLLSWFKRPERQALGLLCSPRVSSARGRQHGGVTQGVFAGRRKEKREGGNHETGPDSLAFSYPQLDQGLFKTELAEAGFLGRRWSRNTLVKFRCVWELIILRMSKKKIVWWSSWITKLQLIVVCVVNAIYFTSEALKGQSLPIITLNHKYILRLWALTISVLFDCLRWAWTNSYIFFQINY